MCFPGHLRYYNGMRLSRCLIAVLFSVAGIVSPAAAEALQVDIVYVRQEEERLLPLSPLLPPVEDEGVAGALLGIKDNNTTGAFLGQSYHLHTADLPAGGGLPQSAKDADFIVADLHADALLQLAAARGDALIFNVRAEDDRLRGEDCAANVFHIAASRAMKADALAQFLAWKRWLRWFLISGARAEDKYFAAALERAATKFGAEIVEKREYAYEATARRTDSGHMQVQKQLPVFTQDAEEHDILLVADESEVFGEYMPHRAWEPRPVAGTHGLFPTIWTAASEQWGATQLLRRFRRESPRDIRARDYAAWLAVRVVGEAVTRTQSAAAADIRNYVLSDDFAIAGFKGESLSFRKWNRQLRQPVFVANARMLVSVSPQPQFLHERSRLDSLGIDEHESACKA